MALSGRLSNELRPAGRILIQDCRYSAATASSLALRPVLWLSLALIAVILMLHPVAASAEDFYRGKVVNLDIGYSPGGGYDLYARVLAKYLGKHLPGNPTIVPSNLAGAGSLRAANYIYSAAPKDGTAIGTFSRSIAIAPLISSVSFDDAQKFTWL
jgi:tripartite-type tricarboxylate transporter receptor subunit TctC